MLHKDIRSYVPAVGYWLADLPKPYCDMYFDITDYKNYPIKDRYPQDSKAAYIAARLKSTDLSIKALNMDDEYTRSMVIQLVKEIKSLASIQSDDDSLLAVKPSDYIPPATNDIDDLPRDFLEKRLFFLHVVKLIINGFLSPGQAAAKYRLSKTNIRIWLSIYTTYGEEAFYRREKKLQPSQENNIVAYHLRFRRSVLRTCTANLIFTSNRLRHMIRRFRLAHPEAYQANISA